MFNPSPIWVVGGFVRDRFLALPSKDIDFLLECSSFDELIQNVLHIDPTADIRTTIDSNDAKFGRCIAGINLNTLGWVKDTALSTLRSGEYYSNLAQINVTKKIYCDFVIAREEGDYKDGRHPDYVKFSTVEKDLARRDFTINAIAINDKTGEILDPHEGLKSLACRKLVTVRDPYTTFSEHAIRILRCLRLSLTKDLAIDNDIWYDLDDHSSYYRSLLMSNIFTNSIMSELAKMYKFNTIATNEILDRLPLPIKEGIFSSIWLKPTNEKRY